MCFRRRSQTRASYDLNAISGRFQPLMHYRSLSLDTLSNGSGLNREGDSLPVETACPEDRDHGVERHPMNPLHRTQPAPASDSTLMAAIVELAREASIELN